jgi:hypothetical protein
MRRFWTMFTLLAIILCGTWRPATADDPKLDAVMTPKLSLGDSVIVKIDGLNATLASGGQKLSDFVLYLDGHAVATGADRGLSDISDNQVGFWLQRNGDNMSSWTALLGSPTQLQKTVQVDVGVGNPNKLLATANGQPLQATLTLVRPWGLLFGLLFLAFLLLALVKIGRGSDLLRDGQPVNFGAGLDAAQLRRPFSLAQSQMAWWFVLVFGAYIFLFLITGDINTLTTQALTLMGIGTGTALGASLVESTKTDAVQKQFTDLLTRIDQLNSAGAAQAVVAPLLQQRDQLARQLASQNFFTDTLSDVDGISLHRFQIMGWTAVLGGVFLVEVYRNLSLPAFDGTLLAVLGISAGTYLGFKIPEQPN